MQTCTNAQIDNRMFCYQWMRILKINIYVSKEASKGEKISNIMIFWKKIRIIKHKLIAYCKGLIYSYITYIRKYSIHDIYQYKQWQLCINFLTNPAFQTVLPIIILFVIVPWVSFWFKIESSGFVRLLRNYGTLFLYIFRCDSISTGCLKNAS